ncbi:hypothetical protein J6590_061056 [Homalodisca vitripennis]|nr:hypothetical protein J6590_061056 [Homalodisca vitripennis]
MKKVQPQLIYCQSAQSYQPNVTEKRDSSLAADDAGDTTTARSVSGTGSVQLAFGPTLCHRHSHVIFVPLRTMFALFLPDPFAFAAPRRFPALISV